MAMIFMGSLSACVSSQKKTAHTRTEQAVEFSEAEVPYVQVTKRNGKVSTEIITPAATSKVTANK